MKRFIAALFAVAVFATDEDGNASTGAEEAAGDASETMDKVGDWFSSRQEPVEFTSIATADQCMLDGNYHWYKNLGLDGVVIRHHVSGCDIADGARVLTWAQIEDPDTPGNIEGFYCTITFSQTNVTATASADVETQTGTGVDYAAWNDVTRNLWCNGEETSNVGDETPVCERMSISQWQKLASDAATNYPMVYNTATSMGEATCTAHRFLKTPSNYISMKTDTVYKVTSGFKIYNTEVDYNAGTVGLSGSGSANEFTFESATTLLAQAVLLSATLLL